jgi:uncharacterized membrane protein
MKTSVVVTSALAAALALSIGACSQRAPAPAGSAQAGTMMEKDEMAMEKEAMADEAQVAEAEQCFGVARAGHNDCKAGAHACAGQSTVDGDPASFVMVPAGSCEKLVGGSLTPQA